MWPITDLLRKNPHYQPLAPSISITSDDKNDILSITINLPKTVNVPYLGTTSIETIGMITASCIAPWILWYGHRTVQKLRQYLRDKRNEFRTKSLLSSPIKSKTWDKKGPTSLDDFMDTCNETHKNLRKVEDPDTVEKRKEKRDRIKKEQAAKPSGPLHLSPELLQNSRSGLRSL